MSIRSVVPLPSEPGVLLAGSQGTGVRPPGRKDDHATRRPAHIRALLWLLQGDKRCAAGEEVNSVSHA